MAIAAMDLGGAETTSTLTLDALLRGIVGDELPPAWRTRSVAGVFDDSRKVRPGGVFVALRGAQADGRRFIADAVRRGASVVIGEELETAGDALTLNVPDARSVLARLAARWNGLDHGPGAGLTILGVTGTNGKSTTAFMTAAILRAASRRCGLFGTVLYDLCGRSVTADMTTPGPLELAAYLRECRERGADAAVMEVSSHALEQRRAEALRFAAAAFTNLTQDHLDYHGTMEAYAQAKARLFEQLDEHSTAVVNVDDPWHARMIQGCRARVVTYGLSPAAEISAAITRDHVGGTLYRMRLDRADLVLENPLVGRHNVYNAMAAAGLARAAGAGLDAIERGLSSVRNIPGRLQRVPGMSGVEIFVDYAHTPDAIRNVASVLRPLTRRRLILVFGCGGDRDRTKRPLMARAAAEFAHAIVVTSDNPRTEDPRAIIEEIMTGFDAEARRRVVVEPDRRAAIRTALAGAAEGDVVLIAGKGHEDYQIIGKDRIHFDDVEVAIQTAAELAGREEPHRR